MTTPTEQRAGRKVVRSVVSGTLIVAGLVLGTLSLATGYAKAQLTDTEGFVATFAPLATTPEIRAVVAASVSDGIDASVDVQALTSQVFDGIRELGVTERTADALTLLEGPTANGVRTLIHGVVSEIVGSEAFAAAWEQALRASHSQVIATLRGEADAAVAIGDTGGLELQIDPVIDIVRTHLASQGFGLADAIPSTGWTIAITDDTSLSGAATAYALIVGIATWLPWVSILLLFSGVLLSRRRRRAVIVTAAAAAALMALVGAALWVGRAFVHGWLVGNGGALTPRAGDIVYDMVTASLSQSALAIAVAAGAVVAAAWVYGRSRSATALRGHLRHIVDEFHTRGEGSRAPRPIEEWVADHSRAAFVLIGAAAGSFLLFLRPLTPALVVVVLLGSALAVVAVEVLRRPAVRHGERLARSDETSPDQLDDPHGLVTS